MPIAHALLARGSSQTDATNLITTSLLLRRKRLYILQITIRDTAEPAAGATVTQLGNTWTLLGSTTVSTGRIWLFHCQPGEDVFAPLSISNASADGNWESIVWAVTEFAGVYSDVKGNGAKALGALATNVDTGAARTTLTNTAAALASADSVVYSGAAVIGTSTFTVDAGYTEILDHTEANTAVSQAAAVGLNDVSSVWTFTSFRAAGLAVEVKPAYVELKYFSDLLVHLNMDEDDKESVLLQDNRVVAFRYEILDYLNAHRHWELTNFFGGAVTNNTFADIKRTAAFEVSDDVAINWMSDRIRPWMLVRSQEGRLNSRLRTDNGAYATTPYNAAHAITGDIYIEAIDIQSAVYNNVGSNQCIASRWNDLLENNRGWIFRFTTAGALEFLWSTNGTDFPGITSAKTVFQVGIANGQPISVAVSFDANNGAAGRTAYFWYSLDSGQSWLPLGDPVTTATATSIFNTTRELMVGARNAGGSSGFFVGKFGKINVYSGLDSSGALMNTVDFRKQKPGTMSFKDDHQNTWTLQGTASIKPETIEVIPDVWAAWPLGVFLPESPNRTHSKGVISRSVEAYDQLKVLRDHIREARFVAAQGAQFTSIIANILFDNGITDMFIEPSDSVLPVNRDWEPGTHDLQIVNDLLSAINYRSLYFNSYGQARCEKYFAPSETPPQHIYWDDDQSIYSSDGIEHEMDLFNVANKWVLWVSDLETEMFAVYENADPQSPTSSASRKRIITDFRREDAAIPDQAALEAKAKLLAQEASQVLEVISVDTIAMPNHGDRDVIEFRSNLLGVPPSTFSEHEWSFDLKAGAAMHHRIRKIVVI